MIVENYVNGRDCEFLVMDLEQEDPLDAGVLEDLLARGSIDITKMTSRILTACRRMVLATITDLQLIENKVVGRLVINGHLHYYQDGGVIRHRIGAFRNGNIITKICSLSLVDPNHCFVFDKRTAAELGVA